MLARKRRLMMGPTHGYPVAATLFLFASVWTSTCTCNAVARAPNFMTLPGVWRYQGCYFDVPGRSLQAAAYFDNNMTTESCIQYCSSKGEPYAGTEWYTQCFCGSSLVCGVNPAPETDCNTPCQGNTAQMCGGGNRLSLYYSTSPVGPQANPGVGGYSLLGCYVEGNGGRALGFQDASIPSDQMTAAKCMAVCAAGRYSLAGLQYAGQCFCGNSLQFGSAAAPATGCNMPCSGNSSEICGGPNRLDVYTHGAWPFPSTTVTSSVSAATTSAVTRTSTSTTSSSASPSIPRGWSSQGCWAEPQAGRMLKMQFPDNDSNTPELCAQNCATAGYQISGTEYSSQCFCGNAVYNGAQRTPSSDCNMACTGNSSVMCGGADRVSMISKGTPQVYAEPVVQKTRLSNNWAYQGCYTDNVNRKSTLPWEVLFYQDNLTANVCLDRCGQYGYMAAGLEYGQQCFCGDEADVAAAGSTLQPESSCNMACTGNATYICGGENLLSIYFWTGAPLNTWSFPQDYRAGLYQFLIGGVTVPLMTTQSLTGKVTFVSKWQTGPPNDTGTYELDLTLLDQFEQAWRPLNVKTDVFCAAGLVLPDKVGRQLTIGGWSGDSTEGVRLYWPDGSDGVWGTNDWEESVAEVRLQTGRWYPGAMIMANGSILVVGGEVGSNGAGVPTIEILPPNGSPPLYMNWLEESYPYNLYPFLTVLPSGNILVGYANQSRVLDPVTLDTIKMLPMVPTAVNTEQAGRTYPLEGTMVTLPQKAPYTDPLEVLICGGSTIGAGFALDNCVSTFPDAPNPQWRIERMPSVRVMPCMAPLPDGTFLIANGAMQGAAGFGLASQPNLKAVLYDPSQPHGSRMSSMAGSPVARLYHSELITLLDGRVLVSGSDPEDGVNPQEYRVEVFLPPYLLNLADRPRPSWSLSHDGSDWAYGQRGIPFAIHGTGPRNGNFSVTLLGAVSTTHGNSFGARTLFPAFRCMTAPGPVTVNVNCTVDAPPGPNIAPPGWYQMFVLDGGVPAVGKYVRIGGDPAGLGNWPDLPGFTIPGV